MTTSADRPLDAGRFPGAGPVAWLGEAPGLRTLRRALESRLWTATPVPVPVPGPPAGTNPFSHRPDRHAALRWGDPAADLRTLDEFGAPAQFDGLVLADTLGALPSQAARTLLTQLAGRLPAGAPWLLVDRNGRFAPEVLANLRRPESERGEGRGTVRTVEELRRLLEPAGFGIEGARGLSGGRRARLLQRTLGPDATSMWLVVEGRRL